MTRIHCLAAALAGLLPALPAFAQALLPGDSIGPQIAGFKAGIVCAQKVVGLSPAPGTIAGTTNLIEGAPRFISTGRQVPAVLGIGFGVQTRAQNGFGLNDVLVTMTHPPMGDAGVTVESYTTTIFGSDSTSTLFQFDYPYELVTGPWQISASLDGKLLFRVQFEVVPAAAVPDLAEACGYADQIS